MFALVALFYAYRAVRRSPRNGNYQIKITSMFPSKRTRTPSESEEQTSVS